MPHKIFERTWQLGNACLSLKATTEDDKEFCRRVHHEAYRNVVIRQIGAWDELLQDSFFLKMWNPPHLDLICVDGEPAGSFSRLMRPDQIWIDEIQLSPTFQGRGIGSEFMRRQMNEAASHAISVRLQVLKANERAFTFYQRLEFKVSGETNTHVLMECCPRV